MRTKVEQKFDADYKWLRLLFFAGQRNTSKVTLEDAKHWIRQRGAKVIVAAEKELLSDRVKRQLSRQSAYEKDELREIQKQYKDD